MNATTVHVRPALLSDTRAIAEVHIQSWRETYTGVIPDTFMDDDALEQRNRMWEAILSLDPPPGEIVVAERSGQVVGFAFAGASTHPDAHKGFEPVRGVHLYSIYVLRSEQRDGTGTALLDAALGDSPAQRWVLKSNQQARSFYERHGFHPDGAEFADPDLDGVVEIRMVR